MILMTPHFILASPGYGGHCPQISILIQVSHLQIFNKDVVCLHFKMFK
jgi:hypothetical protein